MDRRTATFAVTPVAPSMLRDIYWLKRNPATERTLRWLMPTLYTVSAITVVGVVYLYYFFGEGATLAPEKMQKVEELKNHLLVLVLMALGIPYLARLGIQRMQHRLGTDGRLLYVKLADGRQLALPPAQLVYDNTTIAFRDQAIAVQGGRRRALYEDGELETYIAPLLARAQKLTALQMFRYQIVHREPLVTAMLVYTAVVLIAIVGTGMWQHFLRGL